MQLRETIKETIHTIMNALYATDAMGEWPARYTSSPKEKEPKEVRLNELLNAI